MAQDDLEELPGVGPATADKLEDAGFETYLSVATANAGDLADKADIGESSARDIVQAARQEADVGGFDSAAEVLEHRQEIGKISLMVPDFDEMMGGGIETQSITEFYGEFGAGKSQFTHQLCVNVQLPREHGGVEGRAIFIDTEDSFRPERIHEMVAGLDNETLAACMERDGIEGSPDDPDAVERLVEDAFLERIHVAKAFNSNHQMLLTEKANEEIANEYAETEFPVRLLCVDSIMAHFRAEYVGRGELAQRQQKLNRHIHDIKQVADVHNAAAVIANQVSANPDQFFGDPTQPIGGNILGHASTFRIYLRNSKGDKRVAKLVDAPNLPDGETPLRVTGEGLKPE